MIKDTGPQIVDQARNPFGEKWRRGGGHEKGSCCDTQNKIPTICMSIT